MKKKNSTKKPSNKGLNKNSLDFLLSDTKVDSLLSLNKKNKSKVKGISTQEVDINKLIANQFQPRTKFDDETLNELSISIKQQGIIQPILVRKPKNGNYEIIAGERRWRAAKLAELDTVPIYIHDIDDDKSMLFALLENMQREDLNIIDEAKGIEKIINTMEVSQQEAATILGKSRGVITNTLRLLNLHPEVQQMLKQGLINKMHGRTLLGLPKNQQINVARVVIEKNWSVQDIEKYIIKFQEIATNKENNGKNVTVDVHIESLQDKLSELLAAPVKIVHGKQGKGKLTISYHDLDELDGILTKIGVKTFEYDC